MSKKNMVNIDTAKAQARNSVDTNLYYDEVRVVVLKAEAHIMNNLPAAKSCVIFDVDQTAINQYQIMLRYDFGWFEESFYAANTDVSSPPLEEVLGMYNRINKYVDNIFLTSKRKMYDAFTLELLAQAGYSNYAKLITRPDDDTGTVQEYKIRERKKLLAAGYTILANIGDQDTDLDGGYPDDSCCFKLPNEFYLVTADM